MILGTVPRQVLRNIETTVRLVRSVRQTKSLDYVRLHRSARRIPRHTDGVFRFSFGRVAFNDVVSLEGQYIEIFIERGYEVADLPASPRILDCGGNIGLSVLWFKMRYPRSRITVFEPDPLIGRMLERNVRSFGLQTVDVVRAAVGAREGEAVFSPDHSWGGRIVPDLETESGAASDTVRVPTIRLAEYVDETIDLLKLDIEGSEYDVLLDLCASGKISLVRHIVCEMHGHYELQEEFATTWRALSDAGYHLAVRSGYPVTGSHGAGATPFPSVVSGRFHMLVYAWRPLATV